jgi:NAD(P)-dependent dehydrogenase (short-subunit alcohol dehydrogenase family)
MPASTAPTPTGKVAIVTGAGSGIGRASALLLARRGIAVAIADIDGARAEQVAAEIRGQGGSALAIAVDVAKEDQIQRMIAATVAEFGGLDILHNNAADVSQATYFRDMGVVDMDLELWNHVMSVNLGGVMLGCKHAIPEMIRRGGGAIVNTSSLSSTAGQDSSLAYSSSKGALNTLTRYIATTYGKQGIRCNAVAPGYVLTDAARNAPAHIVDIYLDHSLLPYLAEPEDIASVAAFLASDEARGITGQLVVADCGASAHLPHVVDLRRAFAKQD